MDPLLMVNRPGLGEPGRRRTGYRLSRHETRVRAPKETPRNFFALFVGSGPTLHRPDRLHGNEYRSRRRRRNRGQRHFRDVVLERRAGAWVSHTKSVCSCSALYLCVEPIFRRGRRPPSPASRMLFQLRWRTQSGVSVSAGDKLFGQDAFFQRAVGVEEDAD